MRNHSPNESQRFWIVDHARERVGAVGVGRQRVLGRRRKRIQQVLVATEPWATRVRHVRAESPIHNLGKRHAAGGGARGEGGAMSGTKKMKESRPRPKVEKDGARRPLPNGSPPQCDMTSQ